MTASAPQTDLVGAILSRKYPLQRLVGSGGMGAVYETMSPDDGRPLAVKVLAVEYLHDEDVKSRFLDEGRMCQRLIHPNIVRVFDVATAEDGTPYIVMELLDGVPLSAYTRSGVRVPVQQAAAILQGILAGLGAAHAQVRPPGDGPAQCARKADCGPASPGPHQQGNRARTQSERKDRKALHDRAHAQASGPQSGGSRHGRPPPGGGYAPQLTPGAA